MKTINELDNYKHSRGYRNNNPFNIKIDPANKWHGAKPLKDNTDKVFEQFYAIEFGIRAGMLLIKNYIKNGFDTPRKILQRFAPSSENDVEAYLFFMCSGTPYSEDDFIIPFSDNYYSFVALMALYESNFDKPISFYKSISKLFNLH